MIAKARKPVGEHVQYGLTPREFTNLKPTIDQLTPPARQRLMEMAKVRPSGGGRPLISRFMVRQKSPSAVFYAGNLPASDLLRLLETHGVNSPVAKAIGKHGGYVFSRIREMPSVESQREMAMRVNRLGSGAALRR